MSKKTLLNETVVRKFMKLANLKPLAEAEDGMRPCRYCAKHSCPETCKEKEKHGEKKEGKYMEEMADEMAESHARGRDEYNEGGQVREAADEEAEVEMADAEIEEEPEAEMADEPMDAEEEMEMDAEVEAPAADGMISREELMGALEDFLGKLFGEVSIEDMDAAPEMDAPEMDAPEMEEPAADEPEMVDDEEEEEGEEVADLLETVTKRVAARILQNALNK